MSKKGNIAIIFCLSLLVVAGCGKSTLTNDTSENLQKCQSVCDEQAVMYKDAAANYTSSCYSNCEKIETMNQEKDANEDQVNNDVTDTDEETTTTDEEVMTDANCDALCNGSLWVSATAEERKGCMVSCKATVRVQSKDISDCNNIEADSDGIITEYSCIASKAADQKNPAFCADINNNDDRDSCYMAVAQTMTDKSLCNKLSSEENKAYCNMIFSQE